MLILSVQLLSAQKTQKIDSLLTRLSHVTDASEKVNALVQLSEHHINYDPSAGITYARKALALMKGPQYNLPKTKVLRYLGLCYKSQGNFTEALNYMYQSLLLSEQASLTEQTVNTKRHLGRTYKQQRNRAQAEPFFQDALDYEKANNQTQQAIILIDLGGLCADHGDLEGAKKHYEGALSLAEKGNSVTRKALVISNLAGVYGGEGNYRKAVRLYEEALQLAKSQKNNVREEMFIHGRIGFEYLNYVTDKEEVPDAYKLTGSRESYIAKAIENIEKAADYFKKNDQVSDYQAFVRALPEAYFLGRAI